MTITLRKKNEESYLKVEDIDNALNHDFYNSVREIIKNSFKKNPTECYYYLAPSKETADSEISYILRNYSEDNEVFVSDDRKFILIQPKAISASVLWINQKSRLFHHSLSLVQKKSMISNLKDYGYSRIEISCYSSPIDELKTQIGDISDFDVIATNGNFEVQQHLLNLAKNAPVVVYQDDKWVNVL